jgi:biotin-dependent carboxylase-like uncharacterized protein
VSAPRPVPLGASAWRFRVAGSREGQAWAAALRAQSGVREAWHTETHVAFVGEAALGDVPPALAEDVRVHALPVVFDGPDREEVARSSGLGRGLEAALLEAELEVSFVGFAPGFGYLRGLDARLHLPRRPSPRPRVPAGALALAGGFAGVYPGPTAGGWHLVGRVLAPMVPDGAPRLASGDRVRLVDGRDATLHEPPTWTDAGVGLGLAEVRGLAFVQDGGRAGRLHQGMPPSGALLPSSLARANALVGNPAGAAGIERYGALRLRAEGTALELATDEGRRVRLGPGEELDLDWRAAQRAGYVAVRGGVEVPVVLGGRGTHVRAQLGGHRGRALRRGDVLPVGALEGAAAPETPAFDPEAPIGVVPGPDLEAFAEGSLARLTGTRWRLSHRSDRMGTLLEGGTLAHRPGGEAKSAPLVAGAIEVPPDGVPIVLGPEHPTTGGYPVLGVVDDLEALLRRPLGAPVRFRLAP